MKFTVSVGDVVDNETTVEVNGVPYKVEIDRPAKQKPALTQSGHTNHGPEKKPATKPVAQKPVSNAGAIKCPLPGTIMSIAVKVGDPVKIGDKVAVLEAMKMENDIRADRAGTVKQICVSPGDAILEGADILILD